MNPLPKPSGVPSHSNAAMRHHVSVRPQNAIENRKRVGPGMQEYASRAFKARCLPEFKCALFVRPKIEAPVPELMKLAL